MTDKNPPNPPAKPPPKKPAPPKSETVRSSERVELATASAHSAPGERLPTGKMRSVDDTVAGPGKPKPRPPK